MALPGANKVWRRRADGRWTRVWYAWRGRGAPEIGRFDGATKADVEAQEASLEGAKRLADGFAAAAHPTIDATTLGGVLAAWVASAAFRGRSESTRQKERGPVDHIRGSRLGDLPAKAMGARGARRAIAEWLGEVAEANGPRAADTRRDILSKALNWAKEDGLVTANPAEGIADFHYADRSDIIWLGEDLQAFEAAARAARRKTLKDGAPEPNAPPAVVMALLLACYTGLRREDLCNLAWRDVGPTAITVRPLKSVRRAKTAKKRAPPVVVIPRTPELDAVLTALDPGPEQRGPWVLTNSFGKRWTPAGLTSSFIRVRDEAGVFYTPPEPGAEPMAKRLHDARGTFVTHMRCAGFGKDEVADMVGWSTEDVDRVAKRYADADRIALAWLERIKRAAV